MFVLSTFTLKQVYLPQPSLRKCYISTSLWREDPIETIPTDSQVFSVAYDPNDEREILAIGQFGSVLLWDTSSNLKVSKLRIGGPNIEARSVAFGRDHLLAAGTTDGRVYIWNARTLETICVLRTSNESVYSVSFGPYPLLAVGLSQQVAVFNLVTREKVAELPLRDIVFSVKYSNNTILAGASSEIALWPSFSTERLRTLPIPRLTLSYAIDFSKHNLLAAGFRNGEIWVWDVSTGDLLSQIQTNELNKSVLAVAFTPESFLIAGVEDANIAIYQPLST
jgi:WD40 repeat protein